MRWPKRSLRYATTAALVSAHERGQRRRPVGRPRAHHPRGAGPRRRGRGHRDRRRARRPQEHGVPPGHARWRRTASSSRPPSAAATGSASACSGWPARPPRGSTWSRRRGRSAASSPPTPARPSTSRSSRRAPRSTSTRSPAPRRCSRTTGSASTSRCTPPATARCCSAASTTTRVKDLLGTLSALHRHHDHQEGQAPRGARPGPRAGVRRRGRRARGGADRRGRPDPQRARRRDRLDERLRTDVPAAPRSGSTTSSRCSSRPPPRSRTASAGVNAESLQRVVSP